MLSASPHLLLWSISARHPYTYVAMHWCVYWSIWPLYDAHKSRFLAEGYTCAANIQISSFNQATHVCANHIELLPLCCLHIQIKEPAKAVLVRCTVQSRTSICEFNLSCHCFLTSKTSFKPSTCPSTWLVQNQQHQTMHVQELDFSDTNCQTPPNTDLPNSSPFSLPVASNLQSLPLQSSPFPPVPRIPTSMLPLCGRSEALAVCRWKNMEKLPLQVAAFFKSSWMSCSSLTVASKCSTCTSMFISRSFHWEDYEIYLQIFYGLWTGHFNGINMSTTPSSVEFRHISSPFARALLLSPGDAELLLPPQA